MRSKFEVRAHKELEEQGYFIEWKIRSRFPIRGYSVDFWNRFDLIAYKFGEPLRWISIKGRAGIPSEHLQAIREFKLPSGNIKEIWARSQSRKRDHYWNKVIVD